MQSASAANQQVYTSFIVSGSTVAVVGMILTITSTMAFVAMTAFGIAVVVAGVVLAKRSKTVDGAARLSPNEED